MSLIGNFFGLMFSGGYLATKVGSQKALNKEYEERAATFRCSYDEMSTLLKDYQIENAVESFVANSTNKDRISELLINELEYITSGDKTVTLLDQQIIDLLMSRFGKISSSTFAECTRLGNLVKVGESLNSYNRSIRVMQCVESNIYAATGRYVMFGVNSQEPCFNGKFCSAKISVIFGGGFIKTIRVYDSVKIPYKPISLEEITGTSISDGEIVR